VLSEIRRVLRPGGRLFFTVPFLWPLHEVPYDYYRYTPFALQRHLENTGFSQIELHPLGGWDASLAQMIGLWVRRRPMRRWQRRMLSWLVFPLYCLLIRSDRPENRFRESVMLTGLWGIAIK
jgi:SAM-dependent methyltransferase